MEENVESGSGDRTKRLKFHTFPDPASSPCRIASYSTTRLWHILSHQDHQPEAFRELGCEPSLTRTIIRGNVRRNSDSKLMSSTISS